MPSSGGDSGFRVCAFRGKDTMPLFTPSNLLQDLRTGPKEMMNTHLTLQREKLLALRARLRGEVTRMTDYALKDKATSMPNHLAELGSDNFDQELTLSLLGSGRNALDQIDAAIGRIEDGSYGQCETCGVEIPRARLAALPYAAQCIHCASEQEELLKTFGFRRGSDRRALV
jgi:DnaK suppressor protein